MRPNLAKRVQQLRRLQARINQRLSFVQNARLATGGLLFATLFLAALQPQLRLEIFATPVFILIFIGYVMWSRRLTDLSHRLSALTEFYQRQDLRKQGRPVTRNWSAALRDVEATADLTAIHDLNLFGEHSLFTLLDETVTDGGRRTLALWLTNPNLTNEQVVERQQQIRSLRPERWFLIRVLIAAAQSNWSLSTGQSVHAMKSAFLDSKTQRLALLTVLAWFVTVALIAICFATRFMNPAWFVLAYWALSIHVVREVGSVFLRGTGLSHHLTGLVPIFSRLEKRLQRPGLEKILPVTNQARPLKKLRRFNRVLDFLSIKANPVIYFLVNAVLPWTALFTYLLEKERQQLAETFPTCLEEFNHLEALGSLVLMTIYQTEVFPQISKTQKFACVGILHPLIPRDRVVGNDFSFPPGKHLGLLTGSNMSGKSTFLRSLGINQVLANMGAPVFAQSFSTSVLKIGSCIQVSDSLRDGFSYFYSEVVRLKTLIEEVQSGTPVLFLVDEIFRGTNNRERHIGSRAVIRSLAAERASLGFVSTHDLELTVLEEKIPAVLNLHFREDIKDGEMSFSYRLQPGPCQTTNALTIMKKAGLDLEDP